MVALSPPSSETGVEARLDRRVAQLDGDQSVARPQDESAR